MASLILHNVPDALIEQLEEQASVHKRSVEDEALQALQQAYSVDESLSPSFATKLRAFLEEPRDGEEWENDPFENVRDESPGRERNPWQD